jgi:polyferredoxin
VLASSWAASPHAVDVIRDRGVMAREVGNGDIENVYRLQITNGTEEPQTYTATAHGLPGLTLVTASEITIPATGIGSMTLRLTLRAVDAQGLRGKASPIFFDVRTTTSDQPSVVEEKSTYLVPR